MNQGRIIRLAYYAIVAILVIMGFARIFGHSVEEIEADNNYVNLLVNQSVYFGYITMALVVIVSLIGMVTHFKQSIWALIGVGVLLVVFWIAWTMSTSGGPEFIDRFAQMGLTEGESRMSEAGIRTMFILGGLAILGALASGVKGLFE
ncbi:MAG: hypothetical protein H6606_02280 [Flavobacteriales bacterium]|nr:hypothetical protein [Flavobacteriales bacterium]